MINNELTLKVKAVTENESFVRLAVASFCALNNPSVEDLGDIKTAISEAFTNCCVHAYPNKKGDVEIYVRLNPDEIYITVTDFGIGIENVELAKQPFYTSKPNSERSGMGFTVMEGFMDSLDVKSLPNQGVKITMIKKKDYCVAVGG